MNNRKMTRYIALLRGINISGKNKISMPELKAASARNIQAVLAPCPPLPCHLNSTIFVPLIFNPPYPVLNKKSFVPQRDEAL